MVFERFHTSLTLDPKGRVTLPSSVRASLAGNSVDQLVCVALDGPEGGLSFFIPSAYAEFLYRHIAGRSHVDPYVREFLLAVDSTSQNVAIDANGRILVPPTLRGLVGLERDLTAFSLHDTFEVWDAARFGRRHPKAVAAVTAAGRAGVP